MNVNNYKVFKDNLWEEEQQNLADPISNELTSIAI